MPEWLAIAIVGLLALVVLLALGGALANARRRKGGKERFRLQLDEANRALALAHAEDKGWERSHLLEMARVTLEEATPGQAISEPQLVQVIDRPGTDQDRAVFRSESDGNELLLTLGRSNGEWVRENLSGVEATS